MTDKKLVSIDEYSLPKDWKASTLADVTEYIQRGKGPKYIEHSDLPVINQKCIRWFGIQKEHLKYVDPAQWTAWAPERYIRVGDILWNSTGTGTIGRAAIIKNLAPEEKYVVDSHVTIVRPKGVDPQYVHYWIMSPAVQGSIEAMQSGSTNQVELSKLAVEALPIPVAPLDQQKRIVAEIEKQFSRLDEAVANLKRVKANLKRYKAAVLKAAVEGRLVETEAELARREGRSYETGAQLLQRILETRRSQWQGKGKYKEPAAPDTTELPELPEGWVWTTVGELGDVIGGLTKNPKRAALPVKLPYLRVANVYANELRLDEIEEIGVEECELEKLLVQKGDLLIVEGNGSPDQIGRLAIWDGSITPCVHQNHLIKVRLPQGYLPKWVMTWLISPGGRNRIRDVSSSTTGLYTLSVGKVGSLSVPLPPKEEQESIVAEIDRRLSLIGETIAQVDANVQRAERLRQSILRCVFSGRFFAGLQTKLSQEVMLNG